MPRLPLHPSSGIGLGIGSGISKTIRFVRLGCANRPFYHIVVMNTRINQHKPPIEQLGSYDPLTNKYNEKIIALNCERIQYWIARGAHLSRPVTEILGIAGFFPIHPRTFLTAWRNRRKACEKANTKTDSAAEAEG